MRKKNGINSNVHSRYKKVRILVSHFSHFVQFAALLKSRKGDIMGTHYTVQEYELKIINAPAAIAMLRVAIQQQIDAEPERPSYYDANEWATDRAAQKSAWQSWLALPDAEFLASVAGKEGWQAWIEGDRIEVVPPDERKFGIEYNWLDMIAPYVMGYIEIYEDANGGSWRISWNEEK